MRAKRTPPKERSSDYANDLDRASQTVLHRPTGSLPCALAENALNSQEASRIKRPAV